MADDYGDTQNDGYGGSEMKSEMSQPDQIKWDMLRGLFKKNVNLNNSDLSELTGFSIDEVDSARVQAHRSTIDQSDMPLSYDYILAFSVGDPEKKKKPSKKDRKARSGDDNEEEWENGMDQTKYFGQIFMKIYKRLGENDHGRCPRLSVKHFKSKDDKWMYLLVGITEQNLKFWADERDTDLLIDPENGCLVGRSKGFALAERTYLEGTDPPEEKEPDEHGNVKRSIDITNWEWLYAEYNQGAQDTVYKKYPRSEGSDYMTVFDEKTRLRIIYETLISDTNEGGCEIKIEDYILSKKHPLVAVFPLEDPKRLTMFEDEWIKNWDPKKLLWCPLSDVRDYFGEPVAFYFAFLGMYLRWLIAPAIIGVLFFICQMALGELTFHGIPLMCIFIIFWCVAFVDFWLREESRYRLMWGMTKFETKAVARPQFTGEWVHDSVTGLWAEEFAFLKRAFRMSSIFSGILFFLFCCIASVVSVLFVRDQNPTDILLKIGLGCANGAMIAIFDIIYKFLSQYGNDWENHRTDQDYQNALITKSFFFKFFNSFASLFYLGFARPFYKGDEYYLRYYPGICRKAPAYMTEMLEFKLLDQSLQRYTKYDDLTCYDKSDDYIGPTACRSKLGPDDLWLVVRDGFIPNGTSCPTDLDLTNGGKCPGVCDELDVQVAMNEAVLNELQIQLLSLFLTALVIQNVLEVFLPMIFERAREDKAKKAAAEAGEDGERNTVEVQQGKDAYANTIEDMSEMIVQFGYVTLFVMAFPLTPLLALMNNIIEMKVDATNLVKTSQRPHPNGSFGLGTWNGVLSFFSIVSVVTNVGLITFRTKLVTTMFANKVEYKWIFFTILAAVLLLMVAAEKAIIPDVPDAVEQGIERQRLVENVLVMGANVDGSAVSEAPGDDDDDDGPLPFDPNLEFSSVSAMDVIPMENIGSFGLNETA